jgi:hypothetical protein
MKTVAAWFTGPFLNFFKAIGEWFAGPFANLFTTAFHAIATVATWLWDTILGPVFNLIGAAVRLMWELSIKPVIGLIVLQFKIWAAIATWLWDTILSPAIAAIGAMFQWLWHVAIKPIVDFIVDSFKVAGAVFLWLYNTIVVPTALALGDMFVLIGKFVVLLVNGWRDGFNQIAGFINTFTDKVTAARDWVISHVGDIVQFFKDLPGKISSALATVGDFLSAPFRAGLEAIKRYWNDTIGGKGFDIPSWVPFGVGGKSFRFPTFHQGIDRVPGPPGSEMLAVLEAGERVIPADQADAGGGLVIHGDVHITVDPTKFKRLDQLLDWADNLRNNRRRGLAAA